MSSMAENLDEGHEDGLATPFSEADYYARQMRLPEIGETGQARLRKGRVLIVGAGGLGSPALSYLAAAGIGTIGICEADHLEISNLHRQTLYGYATAGQPKALLAKQRIEEQNPFISMRLHEDGLQPENAVSLFEAYDLVLDCTDNFPTKFLINDAAVLTGTPAVFASIYQYEGQLMVLNPPSGGPCMRCLWPDMPEPGCVGSCADAGVLGVVPGILGAMQAMEAIKHFTGLQPPLGDALVILDCLSYATHRVKIPRHPACPVCGQSPRITKIVRDEYLPPADINVDVRSLSSEELARYRIIDIREREEVEAQPLEGVAYEHIAMSSWNLEAPPVAKDDVCLLSCARGMRSLQLAEKLRNLGYSTVYSAEHGWEAFYRRTKTS